MGRSVSQNDWKVGSIMTEKEREAQEWEAQKRNPAFVWWVGWIVLYPLRLIFLILAAIAIAIAPSAWYGFIKFGGEHDPSKWRFGD